MKRVKKVLLAILGILGVLALSACGESGHPDEQTDYGVPRIIAEQTQDNE